MQLGGIPHCIVCGGNLTHSTAGGSDVLWVRFAVLVQESFSFQMHEAAPHRVRCEVFIHQSAAQRNKTLRRGEFKVGNHRNVECRKEVQCGMLGF